MGQFSFLEKDVVSQSVVTARLIAERKKMMMIFRLIVFRLIAGLIASFG
jgi:hypothetical protein